MKLSERNTKNLSERARQETHSMKVRSSNRPVYEWRLVDREEPSYFPAPLMDLIAQTAAYVLVRNVFQAWSTTGCSDSVYLGQHETVPMDRRNSRQCSPSGEAAESAALPVGMIAKDAALHALYAESCF